MEIKKTNLLNILNNVQALYSTGFSDEYKAPLDLLENLIENSQTHEPLFYGLIFLQKIGDSEYIVTDGMKRIISLSLLLHALCECYKLTNKKNIHAIELVKKKYLFGKYGTKIQLDGYEKQIYEKIVKYERMTEEEKKHPMFILLHEYWAKIKMNNLSAVQLFNQIKQIKTLVCVYEQETVDNRDLYQFLNCNNPYIEELKLITNFIEEKAGDSAIMWHEITDLFKQADMTRKIKYFFTDFLTIQKNGIIPKENEIYLSFKRYYLKMIKSGKKPEDFFKTMKETAQNYIKISTANFENSAIKERIQTLKDNNLYETFPYLLETTEDYVSGRITEETFCQLLDTVIAFMIEQKRMNSEYHINFGNLSNEINYKLMND